MLVYISVLTPMRDPTMHDPSELERFTDRCWLPPLDGEWTVEEGHGGWFVVRPFGLGSHGPYDSAREARRALTILRTRAGD